MNNADIGQGNSFERLLDGGPADMPGSRVESDCSVSSFVREWLATNLVKGPTRVLDNPLPRSVRVHLIFTIPFLGRESDDREL